MSGSKYTIACPKCSTINAVRGKAMTLALTCSKCNTYFRIGAWNKDITKFANVEEPALPIGTKGKIDNTVYEVMGFVVKQETKYKYFWREYLLFNPYTGYAFLSEYDGHWNFIWPIEGDPKSGSIDSDFHNNGNLFQLFQKYNSEVTYARGEFFFDVVDLTASTLNYEYISSPRMMAIEHSDDSMLWCEGEYITPKEVAEAFKVPLNTLPSKSGVGYTQPLITGFSEQKMIHFSLLILFMTILLQFFFSMSAGEKVVYQGNFDQLQMKDQKIATTPSFNLEGGTKSLEIQIYAPVTNDWFFAEFSLINDQDGTEYNFTKDIEYYKGYEDGESWAEGGQQGEAFISSIPEGRYHINIYPEFSLINHEFNIIVKRDVPTMSNFFFVLVALALFPIGYYIRKRIFERRRWSESDYSPYYSAE